jgi:hypothetical protein
MQTFAVQRTLKGISVADLAAAQQRAIAQAENMSGKGTPVRYLRSTFIPETGECQCLFQADRAEDVENLNRAAQIPFTRVVGAMDLPAPVATPA